MHGESTDTAHADRMRLKPGLGLIGACQACNGIGARAHAKRGSRSTIPAESAKERGPKEEILIGAQHEHLHMAGGGGGGGGAVC